ncbi:uncharacterized protein LOC110870455 [Helianthus annuus]|uniref:uncharacterized protein LOC110870455 n=1 Tax=Helianthus annuus TaxID=4232 RepID=UPI000B8FC07F|nr:uncharacterized protein LOC110870455 [Helianthus annuus]
MSPKTIVVTSSQQLERSPPKTSTPRDSSQKEHVVSTGAPQYEVLPSLESMLNSLSPWANSLSTPLSISPIPPSIIPLFDAIEIQTQSSPSHQHITESTTSTLAVSEPIQLVNPQTTEEATPLEFHEILAGSSSGTATTDVGSTDLHLDTSFINKNPLKATTAEATKVSTGEISKVTTAEGSPRYREKGASVDENLETPPVSTADTTTTGGKLDDPIKLGDDLKYQDLTERLSTIETTIATMNDSISFLVEASKSQSTRQQYSQELWNDVQPILVAQRELLAAQHKTEMDFVRVMVDARYKDTQADIRGIKEALVKLTGTTPAPVFEKEDDDAKKGEKHNMKNFGKPTPRQKPWPTKKSSATSAETSVKDKEKGIDETLNILADEEIVNKKTIQNQNETKERIWKKEQKELKEWEIKTKDLGTSKSKKSLKHNKPPLAIFSKPQPQKQTPKKPTTAGTEKPSTATPKPTPSPQKPPAKKLKTKPSSPLPSSNATDVDAT